MFDPEDADVVDLLRARKTNNWVDYEYLKLVRDVLDNGMLKPTRAKIDGRNVSAYSVFGRQARFSLENGFPILTTKKVNFNAIVHELIWLLSGSDNIQYLKENNVHIWDSWVDDRGCVGSGSYPVLWRSFPLGDDVWGVDQILELIEDINIVKNDATASCGRRLIVSAWHPHYSKRECKLPACHCFFQFNVTGDKLSCQLYQRSADLFLGVPFNISSYALLTHIIAYTTGLQASEFIHTFGDLHIYENHIDQLHEQLNRNPYKLPTLSIRTGVNSIDEFVRDDFKLVDYKHHPALRGEVAV